MGFWSLLPFLSQQGLSCLPLSLFTLLSASTSIGSSLLDLPLRLSLILTDCCRAAVGQQPFQELLEALVLVGEHDSFFTRLFGISLNMAATKLSPDAWQGRPFAVGEHLVLTFLREPVLKCGSQILIALASRRILNLL